MQSASCAQRTPDLRRGGELTDARRVMGLLSGKKGVVFGVANKRSIAWAIALAWHEAGAELAFTYQGERLKDNVEQ